MQREVPRAGAPQLGPFLIRVEKLDHRDVHDMWLDGIQRGDQPLRRTGSRVGILRQERFVAFADVQDDGAALEQGAAVLLEDRNLAERLKRAVVGLVLIALPQEARSVGKTGLLERPAHTKIAHLALRERRNPAKGGNDDHAACSSVIASQASSKAPARRACL